MMKLKPDEIRFWENVFVAYIRTGLARDWDDRVECARASADLAVEQRRERMPDQSPPSGEGPYREGGTHHA